MICFDRNARSLTAALAFAGMAAFGAGPAVADEVMSKPDDSYAQAEIAATHAKLAAKEGELEGVQMHLHHAWNCLVGPEGKDFDAGFGNPCEGQGNGAIADATEEDMQAKLNDAMTLVRAGLVADDVAVAQEAAQEAGKLLGETQPEAE
jgi:hypothetical protein